MSSELDRAVKKGTIHRNTANRRKSALARKLAAI
jgi:ribosomal protein S20